MPYTVVHEGDCYYVVKEETGERVNDTCHESAEAAGSQIGAIEASEEKVIEIPVDIEDEADDDEEEMDERKSIVQFKEDSNGQWWFIGLYSNKFKDRDQEIITEAAHQDYVGWLKETGLKPQVTLYHQPPSPEQGFWSRVMGVYDKGMISTRAMNNLLKDFYRDYALGETETVFYSNGFVGVIAKIYPERVQWVKNMISLEKDWGMSHGFVTFKQHANIYESYRSFEFSVPLRSRAANIWTDGLFITEKVQMDDKDKELLNQIQQGTAEEVELLTKQRQEALESAGIEFKDKEEEVEVPAEEVKEVDGTLLEQVVKSLQIETLVENIKARFEALETSYAEKVTALEFRIKELEKDDDQKIAAQYQPNFAKLFSQIGPANSLDTVVDKERQEEIEATKKSNTNWLQDMYGSLQKLS